MPLYQTIQTPQNATIGLWRIEESVNDLQHQTPPNLWQQQARYQRISNPNRQQEWLATRALINTLIPSEQTFAIDYDIFGKPSFRQPIQQLSISHSKDFAAVILHPSMKLGIDIEPIHSRILRLQHKFLSEKEKADIEKDNLFQLSLYWSAKETLYKLYGKKKLVFKENLLIHSQQTIENPEVAAEGYLETSIQKGSFQLAIKVYFQQIENSILTYALTNS